MGPKKKKKTKKQVQQEEEEALRLAQQEAEERKRQRLARLKEIKQLEEEAKLREKQVIKEHSIRLAVLTNNSKLFKTVKTLFIDEKIKQREDEEWKRYLSNDRLPYPSIPSSMNTHLFYWKNWKETEYMENILEWVEKYIILLNDLDRFIEEPLNASERKIENWKDVKQCYRTEIFRKFDLGTFHILRKIQTKMNRIDYWAVDFKRSTNNVKIFMWGWLVFPVSDLSTRSPPTIDFPEIGISITLPLPYDRKFVVVRVIHVTFDPLSDTSRTWEQPILTEEGNISKIVDYWHKRKLDLEKLLWSEEAKLLQQEKRRLTTDYSVEETKDSKQTSEISTPTSNITVQGTEIAEKKPTNVNLTQNADQIEEDASFEIKIKDEWIFQTILIKNQNLLKEDVLDCFFKVVNINDDEKSGKSTHIIVPLRQLVSDGDVSNAKYGELQTLHLKEHFKKKILNYFSTLPLFEVNKSQEKTPETSITEGFREDVMLLKLNKTMKLHTSEHELNLRRNVILGGVFYLDLINQVDQRFPLKDGSFIQVQYGEYEIDRDHFEFLYEPPKIVESNEDEEEKPPPDDNIDKLIHVEIKLPENILWFEAPTPVLWHNDEKIWSNKYVYEVKFNEEKQKIIFKIGRTLPIGLSAVRYNNLPFQTWELRPGPAKSGIVFFSLTASTVIMEFIIKKDKVSLESLQNATGSALEPILGNFYPPNELINIMKHAGVDIFPGDDAFLYIEGHSFKDCIIEDHVYMSMAMFSPFFQFSWSRWNMLAGWGKLVYQARQVYFMKNLPNYCMIMSDLFHTTIVACSEVSSGFSEESITNIGFHPDLYSLLKNVCSKNLKPLIYKVEIDLINTIYEFIRKTKFFSYS